MKPQTKKLIAPITVTVIMLALFAAYIFLCALADELPETLKIVGITALAALSGVSIFVLAQRIKEIKGGEEDDVGKY